MRVAIVCSGPSAARLPDLSDYDSVIAVNLAAEIVASDYWLFLDPQAFYLTENPLGDPAIVTGRLVSIKIKRKSEWANNRKHFDAKFEGRRDVISLGLRWRSFSATTALAFAFELGAKQIDVYGADWSGGCDFAGRTRDEYRDDSRRWPQERAIWDSVVAALDARGVRVERIGSSIAVA